MLETYKATIHGDKVEWKDDSPQVLRTKKSVEVIITIVDRENLPANGRKMAEILSKIAKKGGIKTIENPSEWQREQRHERILTGREK